MRFDEAVAALDARTNYERTGRLVAPTLDRMRALMEVLAEPQRSFPSLHITGTNGKTTTARAATEVLRAAGLRVATYTSPHVSSIRERFWYDGTPITEDEFVDAWRELSPYLDHVDRQGEPVTWFEAATALSLVWFAEKGVDAAVIEVGMGGAWDATNVVDAQVAVVTRVALDHTHVLGPTPAVIAHEKAAIIKAGSVACLAEQDREVADVLRARCSEVGAEMRVEGMAFALENATLADGGQVLSVRLGHDRYPDVFLPMYGEPLARDAVLGAAAARAMLGDRTVADEVLAEAFGRVKVPGRFEVVARQPLVVLDGAHNPAAAAALRATLPGAFSFDRLVLVVSIMDDKDVPGFLSEIVPLADEVIVTRNHSPRAASPARLAEEVRALDREPHIVQNVADAIAFAIEISQHSDCVCVTGSLYTVGDARKVLSQGETR